VSAAGRLPQTAGVRRYRKGSPGRRPLVGAATATTPPHLPAELLAELLAHVGHGRPLQRQGLLAGQPAKLQAP
jgi:hypothetical protein